MKFDVRLATVIEGELEVILSEGTEVIDEPPGEDGGLSVEAPAVCGSDESGLAEVFVVKLLGPPELFVGNGSDVRLPTEGVSVVTDD